MRNSTRYVFDTSAFIAWQFEIYPVSVFPDVQELIEQDVRNQVIQSPVEVRDELKQHEGDIVHEWAKQQTNLFVRTQPDLQQRIADISNQFPKLVKQHRSVNADPVVIAVAEKFGWIVVTQENPRKITNIVGCCRKINLKFMSLSQYMVDRHKALTKIRQTFAW